MTSSRKWHVDPKTGNMGECHAVQGKCPFGGADGTSNHYGSEAEARAVSEFIHAQSSSKKTMKRTRKTKAQLEEERRAEQARVEWDNAEKERRARFDEGKPGAIDAIEAMQNDLDPSSGYMSSLENKSESMFALVLDDRNKTISESRAGIKANNGAMSDITVQIVNEMESSDPFADEHKDAYDAMRRHPEMFVTMVGIGGDERFSKLRKARDRYKEDAEKAFSDVIRLDHDSYTEWRDAQANAVRREIDDMRRIVDDMESMVSIRDGGITRKLYDMPQPDSQNPSRGLRYMLRPRPSEMHITPLLQSEDGNKVLYRVDSFQYSDDFSGHVSADYVMADLTTGETSNPVNIYDQSIRDTRGLPSVSSMYDTYYSSDSRAKMSESIPGLEGMMNDDPLVNMQRGLSHQRDMLEWAYGEDAMSRWKARRVMPAKKPLMIDDSEMGRKLESLDGFESEVYGRGFDDAY